MQISHQHKLINCSQYGDYCRIDSFGDIPGQVDSLFWGLRILWTIKSTLSLVSGLSLLIVKKFPCGEQMVREANGQNKSRFGQIFWKLFLVVTLSHDFSKMRKHIATLWRNLFKEEEHLEVIVRLDSLLRRRWPKFISAIAAFGICS